VKVTALNRAPSQNQLERFPRKALYPGALPLFVFVIVAVLALVGTNQGGTLGVSGTPCGAGWCIDDVYPASMAWTEGIRPGDLIMEIDGEKTSSATAATSWRNIQSIVVADDRGDLVPAEVTIPVIGQSPLKWSMWVVAGFFATLGTLVWYRRPDLASAAGLGRMAATASVALAIAPAAGGPQLEWALAIQFAALAILGFTFFDFVFQMAGEHAPHRKPTIYLRRLLGALTIVILLGYPITVFVAPSLYEFLLPLVATTLASGLLSSVYVLLAAVIKAPGGSEEDRLRVPLLGMLLGATPFPLATLVPLALGNDPLAPHLTVLPVILIPSAFAYSILHDQLWGIRRLIHRSLVYGLVSAMVLTIVIGGVALSQRLLNASGNSTGDVLSVSIVALLGISLYGPLIRGVRWVIDRAMYGMTPSYPEFVQGLQRDLASADPESELPETLIRVLAEHLDLESALLFRHNEEEEQEVTEVMTSIGSGTDRVMEALQERRIALPTDEAGDQLAVIPFEEEQILAMQLWAAEQHVGTLFLGPKNGGELFIQEEVNLVMNAAPFMAAALERHEVSQTMRQLNRRLVETDEMSRQRMAVDLHDGPLQKAVTLAIGRVADPEVQREVATELVNELRELSSRLRPSILDDLGLPSSLEWLLEHNMRGTEIIGALALEGIDEDQRFDPAVELALFRVTQEAINNAVKHSSATELRVNIERDDEQIALTIKGNGVGIGGTGSGRIPSSRLGMIGMSERVMQVGGHLEVHSWPGRGVFIQATVPMHTNAPSEAPVAASLPQPEGVSRPEGDL
jgi:signal transduction histidine kinase